jgi:hypothetical protein
MFACMIGACVGLCNLLTEDRALDVAMLRVWLHLWITFATQVILRGANVRKTIYHCMLSMVAQCYLIHAELSQSFPPFMC